MAWNKKKLLSKISLYFDNKNISYEIEEDSILKLELYFKEAEYVLYPYITIDQSICSFNINISKNVIKGYNYEKYISKIESNHKNEEFSYKRLKKKYRLLKKVSCILAIGLAINIILLFVI